MPSSAVLTLADPYEYQRSIHAADVQFFLTGRGVFKAALTRIKLHRLWLQRAHVSLPGITHSVVGKERSMFFLQFDPDQQPTLHSGLEVSPTEIVCYPPGSEHHYRTSAAYYCGGMSLTHDDLAALGVALTGHPLVAPATTRVVRPPSALMARLQSLHKAAADLAVTAPDNLAHPEVAKSLEQELLRAMIDCLNDAAGEQRDRSSRTRFPVMRRLEQILEASQGQPLYVTDICAGIGISERALRAHCQEKLGMSPHRYLWLRRMNLARRAMALAGRPAKTVTEIANDYGFAELGRFAVAYRRLFGEPPSATLRRPPIDPKPSQFGMLRA